MAVLLSSTLGPSHKLLLSVRLVGATHDIALLGATKCALLASEVPASEDNIRAIDRLGADRKPGICFLNDLPLDCLHA